MSNKCICNDDSLTKEEKWRNIVGTDNYGNLPEYKKSNHVGHCWKPCPYSTDTPDELTRLLLNIPQTDPLPTKNDHTHNGVTYYMNNAYRGGWGFVCTFDGCPYYLSTGERFFIK